MTQKAYNGEVRGMHGGCRATGTTLAGREIQISFDGEWALQIAHFRQFTDSFGHAQWHIDNPDIGPEGCCSCDQEKVAEYKAKEKASELAEALGECIMALENIEAFIDEETDKKIQGKKPNWANACKKIWHEVGNPLANAKDIARGDAL